MPHLDLTADVADLTAALVNVPSVSHDERVLADAVEEALLALPHLTVERIGNNVVARTELGRDHRVVLGGHLDTVPAADNAEARLEGDRLYGLGSCDMKGGVAVSLHLAATVTEPVHDVTYLYYACEEVQEQDNGLRHIAQVRPDLLVADFAILMEPSCAGVEAGCQGTLRALVTTDGVRAHSARSWRGENAIHRAASILERLNTYTARVVPIDGLEYREGLSAVGIEGGVAGNVIPDRCTVTINYRYAPDRTPAEATAHVNELFAEFEVEIVDNAGGALPGLKQRAAADFVRAVGAEPRPKYGWTDVARFASLGVPAVNFGPGDPSLAHTRGEFVPLADLRSTRDALERWLKGE